MKITTIELFDVNLPPRKDYRWAGLNRSLGRWLLVKVHTDEGLAGWGEATALPDWGGDYGRYYGETPGTVRHVIADILAPDLRGADPFAIESLHARMDALVRGHPYAKAALDMALYDVMGRALDVPVHCLIGGRDEAKVGGVPVAHMLGLMPLSFAVEEAAMAAADGVTAFQVKGGVDTGRDVDLVQRLREELGPTVHLRVDANMGYGTPKAAIEAIQRMRCADVAIVEQPVQGVTNMARVAAAVEPLVMADESAWTPQDVLELSCRAAADAISIYIAKAGGMFKARKVAAVAEAAGLPCDVNGSIELGIGNAANIQFALATRAVTLPCVVPVNAPRGATPTHVAGSYYDDDVVAAPFVFRAGCVDLPDTPGLGIEVDEEKVRYYAAPVQ